MEFFQEGFVKWNFDSLNSSDFWLQKMKAAPTTAEVEDIEDLLAHMEIDPELELEEELPVEEEMASANIPQLPITMDQSAGMMDLNKLLEDN